MKSVTFAIATLGLFFGQFAHAAQVNDARLDVDHQVIQIDVTYSGGCEQHDFQLKIRNCTRATPMTCVAALVDNAPADSCRQIVQETVEVPVLENMEKPALADMVIVGSDGSAVHLPLR